MSTRCMIHFHPGEQNDGAPTAAIVYKHSDGYPEDASGAMGMVNRLSTFFQDVLDNAEHYPEYFFHPEYLAAKFIVWEADRRAKALVRMTDGSLKWERTHKLEFAGVGVAQEDHADAQYRYHVWCWRNDDGVPSVTWETVDPDAVRGGPMQPDFSFTAGG